MSNELKLIEKIKLVPFFTKGESVDDILEKISKEARSHVPDITTQKGRNAIKANVTRVTGSKTYLEAEGKKLAAEYKAIPKSIDANRKKVKDNLTDLQAEIRKPLTDWENKQAKIEADLLAEEEAKKLAEQFQNDFEHALLLNEKFDRERKDLAEKLERERVEREDALKKLAAEEATKKAEQEASDRVETAEREQRETKKQLEAQQAQTAENERLATQKAEQDERDRIFTKEQADREVIESAERAKQAEIKRQNDEQAAAERAKQAREDDVNHKRAINNGAKSSLISIGFKEDEAIKIIRAIACNTIRHVTINY
jgi:hypothetical protein